MQKQEFQRRRRRLAGMVGHKGIAILPAAAEKIRSRDTFHPYRQDSDFYYLTGFDEPEAVAVLVPGRDGGEYLLFCRERDTEREQWDGYRAGPDGAVQDYGADDAFPFSDIDDILPGLMGDRDQVFYSMGTHPDFDQRMLGWLGALKTGRGHGPDQLIAVDHLLHEARLVKSSRETAALRRAGKIGVAAHKRGMRACKPGLFEYQLAAEYTHEFARHGLEPSYQPIVASGVNACTLHYVRNEDRLKEGDLVLVDAGCEYDYYASDITRTFPVSGQFTSEQRDVYDIVCEAQQEAIAKVRAGNHWNDPHDAALKTITRGLKSLGLIKGRIDTLLKKQAYRPFFMHRTGHWLGMDVHDVGDYRVDDQWRLLEPGMALTVEPGLYLSPGLDVPKPLAGIGVRIEDDVLVTSGDPEILSPGLPTTSAEVEAYLQAST